MRGGELMRNDGNGIVGLEVRRERTRYMEEEDIIKEEVSGAIKLLKMEKLEA